MVERKQARFKLLTYGTVIFSVTLYALVLGAGGAIFKLSTQHAMKEGKNAKLASRLKAERAKVEAHIGAKAGIAEKMAVSRFIQRYFEYPSNDLFEKMAFDEIAKHGNALTDGAIYWVNSTDKKFYYNGAYAATVNPSNTIYFWYEQTLYGTDGYNLSINYNPDIGKTNLWINAPVFGSAGVPVGMVGVESDLDAFIGAVYGEQTELADFTELYFFNSSGRITCAKDLRLVTSKNTLDDKFGYMGREIRAAARKLRHGEARVYNSPMGDVGISMLPASGWYALIVSPSPASNHKSAMEWLFISMAAVMGISLVIFNIFLFTLFKPLKGTMNALEAALKVKDDFLAKMSHEIRTPMNAVTGMAELALREEMNAAAQEHVYTIKQAGSNLLSIINDILDLSKIESGKLEIIPSEYHFGSLVNDVVSIIRMRVVDSGVRFVVNTDSRIPGVLVGDEVRVRQIMLNILGNAVKYTKEGFISLVISGKMADDETIILTIDVADTGRGIKQEDIGRLFGTFVQVDAGANRGIEGTGLGLVITKNLTTAMGGNISVTSKYGKGSTFTVTLPQKIHTSRPAAAVDSPETKRVIVCERRDIYANSLACTIDNLGVNCTSVRTFDELCAKLRTGYYPFIFVESPLYENVKNVLPELVSRSKIALLTSFGNVIADKDVSVIAMPAHSVSVANILNGVSDGFSYHTDENTVVKFNAPDARVLVVDDIKTNLEVTKGLLSPYNMQVELCLSGAEAVQLVKANRYDLIFMDHMMPEMDGIQATKYIRCIGGAHSKVPIIALTANAVSGAKEMFLENDFNGFLSKPVDIPKLNAILEMWIPKKKQKPAEKKTERLEAQPEIAIAGVDVKSGIARMGGSAETYMRTLSVFRSDGRVKVGELKKCLLADNLPLFTINVHALKGAAANVGANALSDLAKDLEAAGKREDRTFIKANIGRLLAGLETLLRDIDVAILETVLAGSESAADRPAISAALNGLGAAINNLDPDGLGAAAAELRRLGNATEFSGKIEAILQNAMIGEHDAAVSMIESLQKEVRQ